MSSPASATPRWHILVAILVASLVIVGSLVIAAVSGRGGLGGGPTIAPGTTLEVGGGSRSSISVTGDHLEIMLKTSAGVDSGQIVVGSSGFQRDSRASSGTFGLRLASTAALRPGVRQLTIIVPENGTLVLTVVGGGALVTDQIRLRQLRMTGVSSSLELNASQSGSSVDFLQIDSATGGLSGVRLGNLNMMELSIGNVTGRYDLDLSGSLDRHCDVIVRSVIGNGILRIPASVGAQVTVKSIVGSVLSGGFTDKGGRSYVNRLAAAQANPQLVVQVDSAIGQIQLMEVQQ
jgi:hypothetical protein